VGQKSIKTTKPAQRSPVARSEGKLARLWRETVGELRKVNWPTTPEALRLTRIVLIVMAAMAAVLGLMDFIFSRLLALIYT
jgi:preprotein translocase subunit SecE